MSEIPNIEQEQIPVLRYEDLFAEVRRGLSERELQLLRPPQRLQTPEDILPIRQELEAKGFVRFKGGPILMGANEGLPCSIEGERSNETPVRVVEVPPFYISKNTVTNIEFEEFDKRHSRTNTSRGDRNPVTCLTYGRAISYILWLNERTGLSFRLPTEPEYVASVAPYGWQFPYKENGHPSRKSQNHFRAFPELYPDRELGSTVQVDDPIVPPNYLGLNHPTGNVSIFSFGHYSTEGHWGANSDGSYVVILGGNFRLCPFSTRSLSRGILDVTGVADTVGIRLVHPDPEYLLDSMGKL